MRKFLLKTLLMCSTMGGLSILQAQDSITANYTGYLDVCQKASEDPYYFNHFRSLAAYRCALEITDGSIYAHYVRNRKSLEGFLGQFLKLDQFGNPEVEDFPGLGRFSATTLRYIFHADQILKYFNLPAQAKVVEIGAGFGGQAYILQCLQPCSEYYIYDLPPVEALIGKMMEALEVATVTCLPIDAELPEESVNLLISNYAYSECDREMQLAYFERVIRKAERGYLIYNQISRLDYGLDSLTLDEFLGLLREIGCKPKVYKEFFAGAGNYLILWDNTK